MNIQKTIFDGLESVELLTAEWRMVMVTGCGPRIAFLGRIDSEENILYWDKDNVSRNDWKLHGGHRVWITRPMADESEDTYMADNDPCELETGDNFACATAPPHSFTKLSRGIRIDCLGDNSFRVTNFIRNDGNMIYSGGVWSPTCINPAGKTIRIPLGEDSTWDIVKVVIPRKFGGNTVLLNDPQVSFSEEEMIIKPAGILTKRCVCAPKGKIKLEWPEENIVFTKSSKYQRDGHYPLDGCNIAVFVGADNWMGEMETYGIEQSIRPGETIKNEEVWNLDVINK